MGYPFFLGGVVDLDRFEEKVKLLPVRSGGEENRFSPVSHFAGGEKRHGTSGNQPLSGNQPCLGSGAEGREITGFSGST